MKRKIFIGLILVILLIPCFSCWAEDSEILTIIDSVTEIVPYDTEDTLGANEYINTTVDTGESGSDSVTESNNDEVVLLNEIATTLAEMEAGTLFNMNGSQVEYFKGILLDKPFMDYCITFDGDYTYRLYYGYRLAVGDSCNYAQITRVNNGSYNYNYIVTTGGTATVPSGNVYVSTITDGMPILEEVQNVKTQTVIAVAFVVMLALWLFNKILFR